MQEEEVDIFLIEAIKNSFHQKEEEKIRKKIRRTPIEGIGRKLYKPIRKFIDKNKRIIKAVKGIINHDDGKINRDDLRIVSQAVSKQTGHDPGKIAGTIAGGVYLANKIKKGYTLAQAGYTARGIGQGGSILVGEGAATEGIGLSTATLTNVGAEALAPISEYVGVDLVAGMTGASFVGGLVSGIVPAIGLGLLAYELVNLL